MNFRKKYIADSSFYRMVLILVIPMILREMITNLVSMLDNIMIGLVGTEQMSGVSIANQFIFIFNISIFGALSGPSIFGAQFFGKGDRSGQRETFRFRIILSAVLTVAAFLVLTFWDTRLISLYLSKDDSAELVTATLKYGKEYLSIMRWCLIPFAFGQAYSSVMRESGETKIPMYGSLAAVGINVFLDYCLIFGKFGFPQLGVAGAAIATVIAKVVEALVVILWAHIHPDSTPCILGLYHGFSISIDLVGAMIKKGFPLLVNEFLWAAGVSVIAQCYSIRGLDVVAARNICGTLSNLFNVVFIQLGASAAIILGQMLGAGKMKQAREASWHLLAFSVFVAAIGGILMIPVAFVFPMIYNTTREIKSLSTYLIIISALVSPLWAYTNICYFTLRSGGKTGITFLFDFTFSWFMQIPLAYVLAYYTRMDIRLLFAIVTFAEIVKCVIGYLMVRSDIWINNIVNEE